MPWLLYYCCCHSNAPGRSFLPQTFSLPVFSSLFFPPFTSHQFIALCNDERGNDLNWNTYICHATCTSLPAMYQYENNLAKTDAYSTHSYTKPHSTTKKSPDYYIPVFTVEKTRIGRNSCGTSLPASTCEWPSCMLLKEGE